MRVTVCELSNKEKRFKKEWEKLVRHVQKKKSDLVLLPELPFSEWIAYTNKVSDDLKAESIGKHQSWLNKLDELGAKAVVYTKPLFRKGKFYHMACVWTKKDGHKKVRSKYYLPEEDHFYEKSWYDREEKNVEVIHVNGVKIGILICSELWFLENARYLGKQGMDLLCVPRATGLGSVLRWMDCGKMAAIISGAFCISSNRSGEGRQDFEWGGAGWIIRPQDGKVLGKTNKKEPFVTLSFDLNWSKAAKSKYPLYIQD